MPCHLLNIDALPEIDFPCVNILDKIWNKLCSTTISTHIWRSYGCAQQEPWISTNIEMRGRVGSWGGRGTWLSNLSPSLLYKMNIRYSKLQHTLAHSHKFTHPQTQTHLLTHTNTLMHLLTYSNTLTNTHKFTLTHTHSQTHKLTHKHTQTHKQNVVHHRDKDRIELVVQSFSWKVGEYL